MLLEDCELRVWQERDEQLALVTEEWANYYPLTVAVLTVPRELFAEVEKREGRIGAVLEEALGSLDHFYIEPGPRREWNNQAASFDRGHVPRVWEGLRFRSHSEVEIAKALDRQNVDFLPNRMLRHGKMADDRRNLEPDFLILAHGRVGVLEVDGAPWHPAERAAVDHTRDRRFRLRGWVVERFDSEECRNFPEDVVAEFLDVLRMGPTDVFVAAPPKAAGHKGVDDFEQMSPNAARKVKARRDAEGR
jgi:hypothetical protein